MSKIGPTDYDGHSRESTLRGQAHRTPLHDDGTMISLFPFSNAALAAIDRQVNEFADMVINFIELILVSLFW